MYIWRTKILTEDLGSGKVTEKSKMQYLLLSQVLYTIFIYHSLYTVIVFDVFFIMEFVLVAAIVVYGVIKCYLANGGEAGNSLLENFLCLSVPLAIKIGIFVFGIFYIYHYVGGYLFSVFLAIDPQLIHKFVALGIGLIGQYVFFWRMWVHIGHINNAQKMHSP